MLEAWIGQFTYQVGYHGYHGINSMIVDEFRMLAKGIDEKISRKEWPQSRRALIYLIREKQEDNDRLAAVTGLFFSSG